MPLFYREQNLTQGLNGFSAFCKIRTQKNEGEVPILQKAEKTHDVRNSCSVLKNEKNEKFWGKGLTFWLIEGVVPTGDYVIIPSISSGDNFVCCKSFRIKICPSFLSKYFATLSALFMHRQKILSGF